MASLARSGKLLDPLTPRERRRFAPPPFTFLTDRDEYEAFKEAMPDLTRLLRYERRAWSRLKRAIEMFIAILVTSRLGICSTVGFNVALQAESKM